MNPLGHKVSEMSSTGMIKGELDDERALLPNAMAAEARLALARAVANMILLIMDR